MDANPTDAAMRRALARARDGKALDVSEAAVLLHARGADLDRLLEYAGRVRDAGLASVGREGTITYSRKVFIPLTRLCRDRCGYCTFATAPGKLPAAFLSPDEVLDIARAGAAMGCKEALFTLGDRPEDRWHQAREWLDAHGYDDTLSYVRAMAIRVLEETGLLPHLNPGVMSWRDLARLKPVAPSMGMMLETTSRRLFEEKGQAHHGSPDKDPAVRLRVLEDAGRSNVPFTTGILIGIGETIADRAESIFAIRRVAREYGGVQEVIVQNFRAKPDTAMRGMPDADLRELAATIAVTRLVLGTKTRVQAPPNLIGDEYSLMIRAGIDDWGGVSPLTPDHVNPERPWPQIDDLAARTSAAGFSLRERLTIYPEYILAGEPWLDPRLRAHVDALADPRTGLALEDTVPAGRPWQEPDGGFAATGRTDLHVEVDSSGRTHDRRDDFDHVYGDWDALRERLPAGVANGADGVNGADGLNRSDGADGPGGVDGAEGAAGADGRAGGRPGDGRAGSVIRADMREALRRAAADPAGLTDGQALTLLAADGPDLEELCGVADGLRREAVGDDVTYVVNRNINFTNVCYTGCRFCAFAQRRTDADAFTLSLDQVADRAAEAWEAGATEVCMQGGIHPDLPGTAYFDIAKAVKARVPGMHVHAFSPMEVINGAGRTNLSVRDWLVAAKEAGVDSLPGTAAEILDDDVRWVLTKGKLPASEWVDVITTAHRVGIPTTSTMMYGHVDTPAHWVAHIRLIRRIQEETGGFSEFVLLPFVHHSAPIYLAGIARPGPTPRENRAVHALARIMLHGAISNIQCSWVKLRDDLCRAVLSGGVNDLGGTLMEETISRMAGSENGSYKTVSEIAAMVAPTGRPLRQRTTEYGTPSPERAAAAAASDGVCGSVRRSIPLVGR
ncbi:bifunctional FO biosynthesis protein CofGH [Sphaerisporangium sp. TRM90804]|uniref:bifunctional FO biosynthesis protein CofGH n=1 Tax=Sphaerisporangium sp. TRM90804 TaxID=3031113 RepID=UPI00244A8D70|nr:bifunctional FO biosynthesis protein CofGH [Sphaerisporangium sp. TRM90804]MDH2427828.1 bifunctional FO biosynthesis protein CofGH [Sphaerisporangium sp. TRM90804]